MEKTKKGILLLVFASLMAIIGMFWMAPIAQNMAYHAFADNRTIFDISNFWNVMSNGMFLVAGAIGLLTLTGTKPVKPPRELRCAYFVFFIGVSLVALGSGFYHLTPNNVTLVWDRLPMTVAFMALFSIIIGEYISLKLGQKLLIPLIIFGAIAVGYWFYTETLNRGDLRLYIIVQFLPMVLIPIILLSFRSSYANDKGYWALLFCYLLAKLCEHFDAQIYQMHFSLSGHTFKHFIAAIGVLLLALFYRYGNTKNGF